MIKLYDQVPTIYSKASRDFQYLSWLINIVLNSIKHNVDDMYNLPQAEYNSKLVELLALTLGFKIKRQYDQKQLIAIVKVLPEILQTKGTRYSIFLAASALVKAAGDDIIPECEVKNNVLEILLPSTVKDTVLLFDLLPYIIPAGLTCKIVRFKPKNRTIQENYEVSTEEVSSVIVKDIDLAQLYDIDKEYTPFTHVNAGLFENLLIPIIPSDSKTSLEALESHLENEDKV